jgi:hypothetical protein
MCDIWLVLMQQCLRSLYVRNIAGTFRPFRNVRKQPAGYMYVMLLEMSGLQVPLLLLDCLVFRDCAAPPSVWCTGDCAAPKRVWCTGTVLLLHVSGVQGTVLLLDVSDVQRTVLILDCLVYRDCAAPPRVWCTGDCAAPRRVWCTEDCAAPRLSGVQGLSCS